MLNISSMQRVLQQITLFLIVLMFVSCVNDSTPNPEISNIQPASGPPGTAVTISGSDFSPVPEDNIVNFNGVQAPVNEATESTVKTTVPDSAETGPVEITVAGNTASGPSFTVEAKAPGISSVEPDSGTVGTEVTIKGMNFSATASENTISFNGTQATVKSAAADELLTEVPQGASDGPLEVTVNQKSTTGPDFDVITDGTLVVHTNTTGSDKDDDRYDLSIDGDAPSSVANTGIATFPDVEQGSHRLELSGIAENCSVDSDNPRTVNITAGDSTETTFDVSCKPVANNRIVFHSNRDGDLDVYSMNADGSDVRNLTNNTASDAYPVISHDGQQIAFISNKDGDLALYVMDADGSNVQKVFASSGLQFLYTWSPDDSKFAFMDSRNGNDDIYTINVDGSNEQRLTNNSVDDEAPSWSPDGSKIAFSSKRDGDFEIYTMNTDGSEVKQITNDNHTNYTSRWSPDGEEFVFVSNRNGNPDLFTMDTNGANVKQVTTSSSQDLLPSWSPDGNELVFQTDRDGNAEIYKINADGSGQAENITENADADVFPFWSPVK
jgi:Tol biopolymer transport system component